MGQELQQIIDSAAKLPERDRAVLAGLMIASLEPDAEPGIEAAWNREIKRRVNEVESGKVELISWEILRGELFAEIHER